MGLRAFFRRIFSSAPRAPQDLLVLGLLNGAPFLVRGQTLRRHLALFGPTGSGKSTQGINIAYQVAAFPSRWGALVLDIKDTLALDICKLVPPHRVADTRLFDAARRTMPPAFNPIADIAPEDRSLASSEILSCLKRYFGTSWGDRQEHILRMSLLALTEAPGATLVDLPRLLTDESWRGWVLSHVSNPAVSAFFEREYPSFLGARGTNLTNIQPILTKLSVLTAYPEIRRILGQATRGIDPRRIIEDGTTLCVNLPQGVLGEDGSSFLASLFIAKFQLAAQTRVNVPLASRRPFMVFADEMQNYQTSAFEKLVTEGRGYGVSVVSACQFEEQLSPMLRLTLAKNCVYQLSAHVHEHRATLSDYHLLTATSLQERDELGKPVAYQLTPLPPLPHPRPSQLELIRAQSEREFCQEASVVDASIEARLTQMPALASPSSPRKSRAQRTEAAHEYTFFEE